MSSASQLASEIGWDDGWEIPVANDENKRLTTELAELSQVLQHKIYTTIFQKFILIVVKILIFLYIPANFLIPLRSKKRGDMRNSRSHYCDTWHSDSLLRHHTLLAFLNLNGSDSKSAHHLNTLTTGSGPFGPPRFLSKLKLR